MNILIIPEDFRKDQYILKPIFYRLMAALGRPRARVSVCMRPLLGGISEALKTDNLAAIIELYPMVHLFILCVDRDGVISRKAQLLRLEGLLHQGRTRFLAECAWEELETWVLAGLDLPIDWSWADVRSTVQVKEAYFEPLAAALGVSDGPGGGRKHLGDMASRRLPSILLKCREDLGVLSNRMREMLEDVTA